MRIDPREIYLKRLLTLERPNHVSFKHLVNLSLMITQGKQSVTPEQEAIQEAIQGFLGHFVTEKGEMPLEYILFNMDKMRVYCKGVMKIKTRYVYKKFKYEELLMLLGDLEDEIMLIVREKSKKIRIINPEVTL